MRPIVASDLMNPDVVTVPEDMRLKALAAFLVSHEISGAPVVDAEGHLVGVVSMFDVARASTQPELRGGFLQSVREPEPLAIDGDDVDDELTVGDVMTPSVFTLGDDAPVSALAALMVHHHLHRVLIVRDDEVVGIVSSSDLLGLLIERT
jgi:CBS domain-containing protein